MNNDYLYDFREPVMQRPPYIVYVKPNDSGYITAINSSAFLPDTTGWTEIDSGYGDKYHHAQGNYFHQPIITYGGAYHYKLVDGKPVECTDEEIAIQEEEIKASITIVPTTEERIAELEAQNEMLLQCVLEMSETVYA